jgi:hypothetical protein
MAPDDEITRLVAAELRTADPRSREYRHGMEDCLRTRLHGTPAPLRYKLGTAAADAWFAGHDQGWALYRRMQEAANAI